MNKIFIVFVLSLLLFSCSNHSSAGDRGDNKGGDLKKILRLSGEPGFTKDKKNNFIIRIPDGYDQTENEHRKYPLVISLHGLTKERNTYLIPSIYNDPSVIEKEPFFFMAPNSNTFLKVRTWAAASDWLLEQVEQIRKDYPIDENRIYLIGFSMGGSGSFIIAEEYFKNYDRFFAGIIRVAGKSQFKLSDEIMKNTSVWYNYGSADLEEIIDTALKTKDFFETHGLYSSSAKYKALSTVEEWTVETTTLSNNFGKTFKISEYGSLGHKSFPLNNIETVEWLFHQKLDMKY